MKNRPNAEIERIQQAYASYEQNGSKEKWSLENPGNAAMEQERARFLSTLLKRHGLELRGRDVLDFGCGEGKIIGLLHSLGAEETRITGVDLQDSRLSIAAVAFPRASFFQSDGKRLPFQDGSFDIVSLFTVLSSILDDGTTHAIAAELTRVLKPGGMILYYDFKYDNPRNANVRGVKRSRVEKLFSGFRFTFRSLTLLPPLARRLGKTCRITYPMLVRFPFLRTHLLGMLVKPE